MYKGASLVVLAMFIQFMMECNFVTTHMVGKHFLLEDIDIWLLEREKMVKNFGVVSISCTQLRPQP